MSNVTINKNVLVTSVNVTERLIRSVDIVGKVTEKMYQNNTLSKISDKMAKQIDKSIFLNQR